MSAETGTEFTTEITQVFRQGLRMFATSADEPRTRRASDVTLLAMAGVVLTIVCLASNPEPGFAKSVDEFLAAFPEFLTPFWQFLSDLIVLVALAIVIGAAIRRRFSIVRDQMIAAIVALLLALFLAWAVTGSWPDVSDALTAKGPPQVYPMVRVALPAAVLMTASPHLTRPLRVLDRWSIGLAALSAVMLEATSTMGMIAGLLVAAIGATGVKLYFGSSAGRPSLELVQSSLAELGVHVQSIGVADLQQAGLFLVTASDAEGVPLVVKVYGRDAHDAALMSTLWRTIWYREPGSPLRFRRIEQVEHEAFMTLLAAQAGVLTDTVVTAGATKSDDALLVARRTSTLLDGFEGRHDPELVGRVWTLVDQLHAGGISHGQLDEHHIVVEDGRVGAINFRGATVAPTELRLRTDEVQAFVTTVGLVGHEEATREALQAIGPERVATLMAYLQPSTLTVHQRQLLRSELIDLDELRESTASAAGVEVPRLQQLRRITAGSIVRVLLPVLALLAIYMLVEGVSLNELVDAVQDANWWIVALGAVLAQLPRFTQSLSTLGAAPVPLPLGPVYALQLAVSYVNLAIPSTAARVATTTRFYQRHGLTTGAALATGAIDGFAGFIVQATILISFLLLTPMSLSLDFSGSASSAVQVLIIALAIAVVVAVVVIVVPKWRRALFGHASDLIREAWSAVRGINTFRRIALLFGGNLATEVLWAIALTTFVLAFGYSVPLEQVLIINIAVSLLAGLLPIPGGIGVTEGGLVYGLTEAGVPQSAAFAAVILYRLFSFYLPPIWGFFAFRWLERNEHL